MKESATQIALFVYGMAIVISMAVALLVRVLYLVVRAAGNRKGRP
jgi:hypothetical protein